jgi:RHS repeat-associated protein
VDHGAYSYVYDGDGNRVKKCVGPSCSSGTFYWKSNDGSPMAESDLSGNWTEVYFPIRGQIAARVDLPANVIHYYFHDHLGSTSSITDTAGNIQKEADYYPYGGEIPITGSDINRYKFTGKERDAESGNDYFGARYMASTMGRFMSPDPTFLNIRKVFNPQRWNLYSYALNNPLTNVDPDGNEVIPVVYPNYQVAYHGNHTVGLGHGGVVLVEKDGTTHYFEYGRYAGPDGMTRNAGPNDTPTPSVQRDASGNITQDSMNNLLGTLSTASGKGGTVDALVIPTTSAEDENILTYLKARQAERGNGQKYSLFGGHNCGTLACETLNHAGMTSVPPMKFLGTPYNNFMRLWFQFQSDAAWQYQPKEHVTHRLIFNDQIQP